jgi:hypothetical protein
MKMLATALLVALLSVGTAGATMNGELWGKLSDDMKVGYAGGFWEAMLFFAPTHAPEMTGTDWPIQLMLWSLSQCMKEKGITIGKFTEIIDRYVRLHPAEAERKMAVTASNALDELCAEKMTLPRKPRTSDEINKLLRELPPTPKAGPPNKPLTPEEEIEKVIPQLQPPAIGQ